LDILGFALSVLLIELTPGPNMAWLAGLAATEGRRRGLAAVCRPPERLALGLCCRSLWLMRMSAVARSGHHTLARPDLWAREGLGRFRL